MPVKYGQHKVGVGSYDVTTEAAPEIKAETLAQEDVELLLRVGPSLFASMLTDALTDSEWQDGEFNVRALRLLTAVLKISDKELTKRTQEIVKNRDRYVSLLHQWQPTDTVSFDPADMTKTEAELIEAGRDFGKSVEAIYSDWSLLDNKRRELQELTEWVATEEKRLRQMKEHPRFKLDWDARQNHRCWKDTLLTKKSKLLGLKNALENEVCRFRGMSSEQLLVEVINGKS